jgi:hypothetical protein
MGAAHAKRRPRQPILLLKSKPGVKTIKIPHLDFFGLADIVLGIRAPSASFTYEFGILYQFRIIIEITFEISHIY